MNFLEIFNDDVFAESKDQCFEKQAVVPNFIVDNFQEVFCFPRYDDYDVDFLEQPIECFLSRNVHLQQTNERNQPTCHSYNIANEQSSEYAEGNSLPLCFSSYKLLKENFKVINEGNGFEWM